MLRSNPPHSETPTRPGSLGDVIWNIARYPWGIILGSLILDLPLLLLHLLSQWSWWQFDFMPSFLWQPFKLHKSAPAFFFLLLSAMKEIKTSKLHQHVDASILTQHLYVNEIFLCFCGSFPWLCRLRYSPLGPDDVEDLKTRVTIPFLIQAIIQHFRSA